MDQQKIDEAVAALRIAADAIQHAAVQPVADPLTILNEILTRLERIERRLDGLGVREPVKEWYTTAEVGEIVGRSSVQVRRWCNAGRIQAVKRDDGRSGFGEWQVSHGELTRYRNHGLRPVA